MSTIKDVARLAGVSIATVSFVLNKKSQVHPDTSERVLQAVKQLGYIPNMSARTLVTKTSKTVYAIITNIMDPFFSPILSGIEHELNLNDYSLLIGSINESAKRLETYLNAAISMRVAGIIVSPPPIVDELKDFFNMFPIPVIQVNRHSDSIHSAIVESDNEQAMYRAAVHLLDLGHEEIALVIGPQSASTYRARVNGYLRAMRERGLGQRVEELVYSCESSQDTDGYYTTTRLLSGEKLPTAVIGGGSAISKGAFQALVEKQVCIPRDISFIGFDTSFWSSLVRPSPLTELSQRTFEMGRTAAKLLLSRILEPSQEVEIIRMPVDMKLGSSTKQLLKSTLL